MLLLSVDKCVEHSGNRKDHLSLFLIMHLYKLIKLLGLVTVLLDCSADTPAFVLATIPHQSHLARSPLGCLIAFKSHRFHLDLNNTGCSKSFHLCVLRIIHPDRRRVSTALRQHHNAAFPNRETTHCIHSY